MAKMKEGGAKVEPLQVSWGLTDGGRASDPSEALRMTAQGDIVDPEVQGNAAGLRDRGKDGDLTEWGEAHGGEVAQGGAEVL